MLGFSALVAGSFSLGSRSANLIAPEAMTALRYILASVILGGVLYLQGPKARASAKATAKAPWRWFVLGGLMVAYFVLMFYGLQTATPVSSAAVFTLTPVMAAVMGWFIAKQFTTPRMALALAIGAAGALWVIFRGDWAAFMRFEIGRGELIYLLGCAFHALYAVLVRGFNRGEGPLAASFATMTAGSFVLLIWAAPDLWTLDWAALPAIVWVTLAYVTLAATAISTLLLQYAALRLPASKVMAYTYLTPSWVILWEIAMGGAAAPLIVLIGIAMTCAALLLLLKD